MNAPCATQDISIPKSRGKSRSRRAYVFEAIQILISLPASLAVKGLLLLHTKSAGVRGTGLGVDNGEGTVAVFVQLLRLVAVGLVVSELDIVSKPPEDGANKSAGQRRGAEKNSLQSILVLVRLFAANNGALERLVFLGHHHGLKTL